MAEVTIIRYNPPNELVGRREMNVQDWKSIGILTQKKTLQWDRERNFWINAEEAGVSPEALKWLEDPKNHSHKEEFVVERQEVEDLDDGNVEESGTAFADHSEEPAEGENISTSQTAAGRAKTTTSTSRTRRT